MRTIVFLVCFCSLLLGGGGHTAYAAGHTDKITPISTHNISKNRPVKFANKNSNTVLIEENDIDLDEEFHNSNELKNGVADKFFLEKSGLFNNWYLAFPRQVILKDYSKHIKIFTPSCGYSNPIYILQGVLRI